MEKSAHAQSALIPSRHFYARIARREVDHFNEVERKI